MKRFIIIIAVVFMAGFSGLAHGVGLFDMKDGEFAINMPTGTLWADADTVYTDSIDLTNYISAGDSLSFFSREGFKQDRTVLSTNAAWLELTDALDSGTGE